ncbi:putative ribonuclease H protein [Senna tora]|uniref:Putative ribonuclease H protein n=1 Tax=Senna tora TaxID=362788 RepID=A0A834WZB8_9FABA|nr:putative ribonuclease H protein [Senna tora]
MTGSALNLEPSPKAKSFLHFQIYQTAMPKVRLQSETCTPRFLPMLRSSQASSSEEKKNAFSLSFAPLTFVIHREVPSFSGFVCEDFFMFTEPEENLALSGPFHFHSLFQKGPPYLQLQLLEVGSSAVILQSFTTGNPSVSPEVYTMPISNPPFKPFGHMVPISTYASPQGRRILLRLNFREKITSSSIRKNFCPERVLLFDKPPPKLVHKSIVLVLQRFKAQPTTGSLFTQVIPCNQMDLPGNASSTPHKGPILLLNVLADARW